jgi:hypothetical protein
MVIHNALLSPYISIGHYHERSIIEAQGEAVG